MGAALTPCPHPRHTQEESTGPQVSKRGGGSSGGPTVTNHVFKDGITQSTHTKEPSRKMRTKNLRIQGDPTRAGGKAPHTRAGAAQMTTAA